MAETLFVYQHENAPRVPAETHLLQRQGPVSLVHSGLGRIMLRNNPKVVELPSGNLLKMQVPRFVLMDVIHKFICRKDARIPSLCSHRCQHARSETRMWRCVRTVPDRLANHTLYLCHFPRLQRGVGVATTLRLDSLDHLRVRFQRDLDLHRPRTLSNLSSTQRVVVNIDLVVRHLESLLDTRHLILESLRTSSVFRVIHVNLRVSLKASVLIVEHEQRRNRRMNDKLLLGVFLL